MTFSPGITISAMRNEEVAQLGEWAATEGWNPGSRIARILPDMCRPL
jgi:hypothetical protein